MARDTAIRTDATVAIDSDVDIISARQRGRAMAAALGFTSSEQAVIATAISELARNIVDHAGQGEIGLGTVKNGGRRGILIVARDKGPGIADLERAMQDGYSSTGSLGLGLPGAKRLADEFQIISRPGRGTTVTLRKWAR